MVNHTREKSQHRRMPKKPVLHLLKLPEGAPAKQALEIYLNYLAKHPRGARKISWVDIVKKDLKTYANVTFYQCIDLAQDRKVWRSIVVKTVDVMS
ncbi:hypothetical protein EB796_022425 [Bugula neritina]|uniref:Uncharacterized protein n=1 Tax=Bugula neritina TaxID=10212 RepID=A0A7J7J0L5_BUGNE|nr:hypothetical protein EB796_022425 [Bugula neritina]